MADEPKAALKVLQAEYGIDKTATERIRGRAQRFVDLFQRSVMEGWEIGRELVQVKQKVEHGYWIPWVETQVGLPRRTAQRLMELYIRDPKKRHVTRFASTADALRYLPPAKPKREGGRKSAAAGKQKAAEKSSEAARSDLTKVVAQLESILTQMPPGGLSQRESDLQNLVKLTVVSATTIVEHLRAPAKGSEAVVGLSEQACAKLREALETITEHREVTHGKLGQSAEEPAM